MEGPQMYMCNPLEKIHRLVNYSVLAQLQQHGEMKGKERYQEISIPQMVFFHFRLI